MTITRKNALFAGSDAGARHWAIANTLIQSCKLNGVEPLAYLTDVLQRIVSGRTKSHELHALLPWNWCQTSTTAVANIRYRRLHCCAAARQGTAAVVTPRRLRTSTPHNACSDHADAQQSERSRFRDRAGFEDTPLSYDLDRRLRRCIADQNSPTVPSPAS